MDITLLIKAALMGIVEGLTEFLPISSTGHLILAGSLLDFTGETAKVFEIAIQTGAMFAVIWQYRERLQRTVGGLRGDPVARRFAMNVLIAFIPAVVLGLAFGKAVKAHLFHPVPVALAFIVGIGHLPMEQLVKAQTLGASTWLVALRVALPQAMPRLIDSLRLSLCPAWVYLISAEAIASDVGLGYRIFLVRRYLAMDIILPYVAWITLLAVAMDFGLYLLSRKAFPWAHGDAR